MRKSIILIMVLFTASTLFSQITEKYQVVNAAVTMDKGNPSPSESQRMLTKKNELLGSYVFVTKYQRQYKIVVDGATAVLDQDQKNPSCYHTSVILNSGAKLTIMFWSSSLKVVMLLDRKAKTGIYELLLKRV
ncbi:MAG: hypothetical protein ACRCZY_11570 [Phocaeicola sp.]